MTLLKKEIRYDEIVVKLVSAERCVIRIDEKMIDWFFRNGFMLQIFGVLKGRFTNNNLNYLRGVLPN